MAISTDILLQDNDLVFQDGDLVIGESDEQHIQDTINAFPGWWKENHEDGVGVFAYVKSPGQEQELARSIKIQLQSDGYNVGTPSIDFTEDNLKINPNANRI